MLTLSPYQATLNTRLHIVPMIDSSVTLSNNIRLKLVEIFILIPVPLPIPYIHSDRFVGTMVHIVNLEVKRVLGVI
jgi:hypothetical protein